MTLFLCSSDMSRIFSESFVVVTERSPGDKSLSFDKHFWYQCFMTFSSFGSFHVIPNGMTVNFRLLKVKKQGFYFFGLQLYSSYLLIRFIFNRFERCRQPLKLYVAKLSYNNTGTRSKSNGLIVKLIHNCAKRCTAGA